MSTLLSIRSRAPAFWCGHLFGAATLLVSSTSAWGVWAKTHATANHAGHQQTTKNCTANGFLWANCTSDALKLHNDGSHNSRGYAHASSYWSIYGWQKSTTTKTYTPQACCSASAYASAGPGFTWAVWPYKFKLVGTGEFVSVPFAFTNIVLTTPETPGSHSYVAFDIDLDGAPLASGLARLLWDGTMYVEGFYEESFFDVQPMGDAWVANYIGPPSLAVELPVDTWVDVGHDMTTGAEVFGPSVLDGADTLLEMETVLPEGYTLQASQFVEDFESYDTFEPLPDQSTWEAWGARAAGDFYATDARSRGGTASVVIDEDDDAVHRFGGYTEGIWEIVAWQYIPPGMTDTQYFILLNTYPANELSDWSLQIECDGALGVIRDSDGVSTLPMTKGQWCEIKVVIDLDQDVQSVYYDGQLLVTKSWTAGIEPGGAWRSQRSTCGRTPAARSTTTTSR